MHTPSLIGQGDESDHVQPSFSQFEPRNAAIRWSFAMCGLIYCYPLGEISNFHSLFDAHDSTSKLARSKMAERTSCISTCFSFHSADKKRRRTVKAALESRITEKDSFRCNKENSSFPYTETGSAVRSREKELDEELKFVGQCTSIFQPKDYWRDRDCIKFEPAEGISSERFTTQIVSAEKDV